LHRAFFFDEEDGGIFNAWLTASVSNLGALFTTLQIFMVGCKLGITFERMVAEGHSGRIPVNAITTIFVVRLVLWPALSISLIYGLAKRTRLLGDDPMLWFSMMLMPVGPPALVISGLAELAQASEAEKMVIAKTLAVCSDDITRGRRDNSLTTSRSCMHYRHWCVSVSRERLKLLKQC
jgi:hypothetical protein